MDEAQSELLGRLKRGTAYPRDVIDLFHDLRRAANEAVHQHRGDPASFAHPAPTASLTIRVLKGSIDWKRTCFSVPELHLDFSFVDD
ncbi:MAG: hypothetical protein JO015_16695 [Verrucomicrobia bacterium]|nr:hypothetical protein [Verrucomicrobiota bacterium]